MFGRKTKFGKQPRTHKCGFPTSRVLVIPLISRYENFSKFKNQSQGVGEFLLKFAKTKKQRIKK